MTRKWVSILYFLLDYLQKLQLKIKVTTLYRLGKLGLIRPDLKDDENGKKVWDYLQDKIKLYVR